MVIFTIAPPLKRFHELVGTTSIMDLPDWRSDSESTLGKDSSSLRQEKQCERCTAGEPKSEIASLEPTLVIETASTTPLSSPTSGSTWIGWNGTQDPDNPSVVPRDYQDCRFEMC